MRPTQFVEYWSQRPLNEDEFLRMIDENYIIKEGTRQELENWLRTWNNTTPFTIEWRQSIIVEETPYNPIFPRYPLQYLVYLPTQLTHPNRNIWWKFEDWYRNQKIPSRMVGRERENIFQKLMQIGWNGLSNYEDRGLELEVQGKQFENLYIQLEYTGEVSRGVSFLNWNQNPFEVK